MRKPGEGVHEVQNAVCVSKSGVLAGVVEGLLGSSTSSQGTARERVQVWRWMECGWSHQTAASHPILRPACKLVQVSSSLEVPSYFSGYES